MTDRQAALRALQAGEGLDIVLRALSDGVMLYDRTGRVTGWNPAALELLGLTSDEIVREDAPAGWRQIREDGTDVPAGEKASARALADGTPQMRKVRGIVTPAGTRWLSVNAQPLRDDAGEVQGVVVTLTDMTEMRRSLVALREEQDRHHAVVAALAEGLVVVDEQLHVVSANESVARMFGVSLPDILRPEPHIDAEILREDGTPMPHEERPGVAAVKERRAVKDCIMGVRVPGGDVRWLSVNAQPVVLPGAGHGAAITFVDVTERKSRELRRESLERQLRQAQKMEAVGMLAGGIAHDFNNILSAVLGNVELALLDVATGHPAWQRLVEIERAGERGRDLVQRLLTFARRRETRRAPVSLAPVVAEVLRLVRSAVPTAITIEQRPLEPAVVVADETELHQVLVNLVTNASAAIGSRTGTITVTHGRVPPGDVPTAVRGLDAGSTWALIAVQDDGEGMDEATQSRMFDPFFTTRSKTRGTGLGLPVVQAIVMSLGGVIVVDSTKGEGTRFEVWLPATDAVPAVTPNAEAPRREAPLRARVLFVDDDPALVTLGRAALERAGLTVDGFDDATQALGAFRANPKHDLVITDVVMPRLSGLELAAAIRATGSRVPIVFTSSDPSLQAADLQRFAPARLAPKPWSHVKLAELARRAIEEGRDS